MSNIVNLPPTGRENLQKIMQRAVWMIDFTNRHSTQNYDPLVLALRQSSLTPAGPALVLAEAVWDLETHLRHPKNTHLATQEEQSYAHLMTHADIEKAQHYPVWYAMEAFLKLRKPLVQEDTLPLYSHTERNEAVAKAFFQLDYVATHLRHDYANHIICCLLALDPIQVEHGICLLADAIWQLEKARKNPTEWRQSYFQAQTNLWHHYHRHPWLQETPMKQAMNTFSMQCL